MEELVATTGYSGGSWQNLNMGFGLDNSILSKFNLFILKF